MNDDYFYKYLLKKYYFEKLTPPRVCTLLLTCVLLCLGAPSSLTCASRSHSYHSHTNHRNTKGHKSKPSSHLSTAKASGLDPRGMASKFGLAGGIPERRVRPIWDAVDSRQFKAALKLSTALLSKYPNSPYALVSTRPFPPLPPCSYPIGGV